MNCDQVFDALTRGPFPTGHDALDERVERHLERCSSCQRLAAALQPAVELFEEAVSPEESCRLPAYWGDLFSQRDSAPTTQTRAPFVLRRVYTIPALTDAGQWRWEHAWRVAAALLLGMALGGILRAALQEHAQPPATAVTAAGDRQAPVERSSHALALFDGLRMKTACGPLAMVLAASHPSASGVSHATSNSAAGAVEAPRGNPPSATIDLTDDAFFEQWNAAAQQKCCTECHHAGGEAKVAQSARWGIASSCALCHDNSTAVTTVPMGGG